MTSPGLIAALEVARDHGLDATDPLLLHEANYLAVSESICWLDSGSVCRRSLERVLAYLLNEPLSVHSWIDD